MVNVNIGQALVDNRSMLGPAHSRGVTSHESLVNFHLDTQLACFLMGDC